MRLAISNIAWEVQQDEAVARLLNRYRLDAIDIAPGKYFPEPRTASAAAIAAVRGWWMERGIEITGMQALLFGTTGLNVFGERAIQSAMLEHLRAVCRIASGVGAKRLVFGSPKNRDRSGLDDRQAEDMAVDFFNRLGAIADQHGVVFCLEPNPPCYGANFMTTSDETARIVKHVSHNGIRMQFDTGALAINGEDPEDILARYKEWIGHVHASEPQLAPLGDGGTPHHEIAEALTRHWPEAVVSIEMLSPRGQDPCQAIERALRIAQQAYHPTPGGLE